MKLSNKEMTISGCVIELKTLKESFPINTPYKSKITNSEPTAPKKNEGRLDSSIYRAKKRLKRLINANTGFYKDASGKVFKPVFLTLTFAENMQDIKKANYEFTKFMQRLNYHIYNTRKSILKYVVAIEFQKRGAIHYHIVLFNMPFVKEEIIEKQIWKNGIVKIKLIKKNITDVGNYMTKYITKELFDSRLSGQKCFFSSNHLFKPVTIVDQDKIEFIMGLLDDNHQQYEKEVTPECQVPYKYEIYNVQNTQFIKDILDLSYLQGYYDRSCHVKKSKV